MKTIVATFRVYDKATYLITESKCPHLQEVELTHVFKNTWKRGETEFTLKPTNIKNHYHGCIKGKQYMLVRQHYTHKSEKVEVPASEIKQKEEKPVETILIKNLKKDQMEKGNPTHFYIGRGSDVGNPFTMTSWTQQERDRVCNEYDKWLRNKLFVEKNKKICLYMNIMYQAWKKHGQITLFCYCEPKRCHAESIRDILKGVK